MEEVWQQTARADTERFLLSFTTPSRKQTGSGPGVQTLIAVFFQPESPSQPSQPLQTALPGGDQGSHPRAMAPLLIPHHSGCSVTIIVMAVLGLPFPFQMLLFQESMMNYLRVYTLFCLSEFPKGLCCIFRIPTFSCTSPSSLTTSDFVSLSSLEFYHLISELA